MATISNGYIDFPVTTDSDTLIQNALSSLSSSMPGWTPREGHLEVLVLEQMAHMVSESATVASQVPLEIFKYFGSLVGIDPINGSSAQIKTTWTLSSAQTNAYTIPAGTQLAVYAGTGQYQYVLDADIVFAAGVTVANNVILSASSPGTSYNGAVSNGFVLSLILMNPIVASVVVTDASYAVGTDAESSTTFLNRLSSELMLIAPRPITINDYATMAQGVGGTATNGGVYRASAYDGINPFLNNLTSIDALPSTSVGTWLTLNSTITTNAAGFRVTTTSSPFTTYMSAPATLGVTQATFGDVTNIAPGYGLMLQGYINASSGASTVASASNGNAINATPLHLVLNTSFASSGYVSVVTSGGTAILKYTSKTSNDLAGVTVVAGNPAWTVATGAQVTQVTSVTSSQAVVAQTVNTTTKVVTFTTPLNFIAVGQVVVTICAGIYISAPLDKISANHDYQGVAVVGYKAAGGNDCYPIITAAATYSDGSIVGYSGVLNGGLTYLSSSYSNPNNYLTVDIPAFNSAQPFAPTLPAGQPSGLKAALTGIQLYILGANFTNTNSFTLTRASLSQRSGSQTNFLPDSGQNAAAYNNGAGSSWFFSDTSVSGIPGIGIQFSSVATLAADVNAISKVFTLDAGSYTLSTYAYLPTFTLGSIVLTISKPDGTTITGGTVTIAPGSASNYYGINFVVPTDDISTGAGTADYVVTVSFKNGLNIPAGYSAFFTQMQIIKNAVTSTTSTSTASLTTSNTNVTVASNSNFSSLGGELVIVQGTNNNNYAATYTGTSGTTTLTGVALHTGTLSLTTSGVLYPGVAPGTGALTQANFQDSNYWTPGGLSSTLVHSSPRNVIVVPLQQDGTPVSSIVHDNLSTYFESKREINFNVNILNPNYVGVEVLWTGTAAQGYDANAVLQAGNAKLSAILNPGNWAGGTLSPPVWDSLQQTISYLNLAGYLDDLIGLASINSLKIRKTGATVWTTADLDMGGLASLPVLTSVSGSVAFSDQAPLEVM